MNESVFLLDTNIASDIFRAREYRIKHRLDEARASRATIALSVITEAELLFGFAQRPEATRLRRAYSTFCEDVKILPWNSAASQSYALLRTDLQRRGVMLDAMDLLIAAHAHSIGAQLVTRDNAFRHIAELVTVLNWATDLNTKQ